MPLGKLREWVESEQTGSATMYPERRQGRPRSDRIGRGSVCVQQSIEGKRRIGVCGGARGDAGHDESAVDFEGPQEPHGVDNTAGLPKHPSAAPQPLSA